MMLLDTTILVYAVGADHRLSSPCRELLAKIQIGSIRACTSVEVIQEFTHVWARRRPRADAAQIAGQYAVGLGPVLRPDDEDLQHGLSLFASSSVLGAFDAVLAASARRRGWALASADQGFAGVENLRYLNPGTPSFLEDALKRAED